MELTGMTGMIELTIMVFALSVAFAVFLIHKAVREKETGLLLLALVLFICSTYMTAKVIFGSSVESSAAPPETLMEQVQETTQ